ncbi:hypothetical protein EIP86_001248 [Pleurotus ostreatoroseus]|nr:hypothetical protein EIP86_001248 [Pleurotus ostreatoroseus]
MARFLSSVVCAVLLSTLAATAPAPASTIASADVAAPTLAYASDEANGMTWQIGTDEDVQPIRGSLGASILGPQNTALDQQNPDLLAPPTTDHGTVGSAKWPMSLSKNRIQTGGWARQQNCNHRLFFTVTSISHLLFPAAVMPIATSMAGVNMRLEAGAIREMHWHKTAEWAYILSGYTQITAINPDGQNFLATLGPGDLWYFPPGVPHSLQATNQSADGTEFLLVFPDGDFSEDSTFLLTDWTAHIPKDVLAKNFQTNITAFDKIPGSELYIFPSESPDPNATAVEDPAGQVPSPFAYRFSQEPFTQAQGGSLKYADSSKFNVSTQIAVAEVHVAPGAMRELHWHPTQDEWGYFIEGQARMTIFASSSNAITFNYQAGDVSFVPATFDKFQDISLAQWLALTPSALVQAHLQLDDDLINNLNKTKQYIVGPKSN